MPYRRLPKTDTARLKALKMILENDDVYTVGNRAVDWALLSQARSCYEKLNVAHIRYKKCYKAQTNETDKYQQLQYTARMFVSHFIQVLNMAVQRGEIRKEYKGYYGLDPDDFSIPDISTDQLLIKWGECVIEGEKERLKKGGVPVYNPTIAKVAVHFDIFKERYLQRSHLLRQTAESRQGVAALREQTDEVILGIWNSIETYYADLPEKERYNRCRSLGVVYYYRRGEEHNLWD